MDEIEKLEFVRSCQAILQQFNEWADCRIEAGGAPSPAEVEQLNKLKVMLKDPQRILAEI
jgi:hypothetical protein